MKTAGGFDEALSVCEGDSPEYAVIDLRMPGRSGMELVQELKRIDPSTKIVILTGYGSIATAIGNVSEAARRLGIHRRSLQRKLQKYPPAD